MKVSKTRLLFEAATSSKLLVFVGIPLIVASTVVGTVVPFATGAFIDAVVARSGVISAFAVLASLSLVKLLLGPAVQRIVLGRSRAVEYDLQRRILSKAVAMPQVLLAEYPDGEMVAKLSRDAAAVGGFVRGLLPRLLSAVVMMVAAGASLWSRSPAVGAAFVLFIPLSVLVFRPFAGRFAENSSRVRKQGDVSFNALFEFFRILPFVGSLGGEKRFEAIPSEALGSLKESNDRTDSLSIAFGFVLGAVLALGEIAVLGVAGSLACEGRIPVGDVVVYQMLFVMAVQSVQGIVALLPEVASIREGASSICEILSREEPERGRERTERISEIEFRNVTFAYPKSARPVVENFSAVFRAGTIIGLAGANGAGKTTLLKLAMGALAPQKGEVLVNGRPVAALEPDAFRARLAAVFQDNLLFTGTVRENVTMRDCRFTGEDISRAAADSGLSAVVSRLPDGFETHVGYRGQALSGGECQRLAIARAVIRNPDVLILDEVTNHLDAAACESFKALVARLRPGRIILLVSHNEEVLRLCDEKLTI